MLSNEQNGFKVTTGTSHSLEAMLWMYSICYSYVVVDSIRTSHCFGNKKVVHMLLPPSTFNCTTMTVAFLWHTVAPDETWALVGNVGKWQ
jgi:hypothetical protein